MRAAVQDPRHLGIPFHRHGGHGPFRAHFEEPDAHFHHQRADAELSQPAVQVLRDAGLGQLGRKGAGREIVHHAN